VRTHRDEVSTVEMIVGGALVLMAALGGVYFAFRPASGLVDGWFLDLVGSSHSPWFSHMTSLRYPAVIIVAAVIAAGICLPRDRPRALACLIGPPLALLASELLFKPMVGRTLGGSLSYPSGSTVGAAALATAAVLATSLRWRVGAVALASAYALWMSVAVVALRWHYPTDALAGLAVGVGVVLVVDGLAWQVARRAGLRWVQSRPSVRAAPPDRVLEPRH
jgi:membrane-associated phospholipid phosphatase